LPETGRIVAVADKVNAPLFRSVGIRVYEAGGQDEAVRAVRRALDAERDAVLVIVLKHLLEDEDEFRRALGDVGVPVLVLPTRWGAYKCREAPRQGPRTRIAGDYWCR